MGTRLSKKWGGEQGNAFNSPFSVRLTVAALYLSAIPTGIADTVLVRLQPAAHEAVGTVQSVNVAAFGTPPQGAKASLLTFDPLVQNEILETVKDGSLAVTFIDGMSLTLGEDTTAVIDKFIFDPNDNSGNAVIQLASGAFHYVSGAMHKKG